jgi:hypothetical protein
MRQTHFGRRDLAPLGEPYSYLHVHVGPEATQVCVSGFTLRQFATTSTMRFMHATLLHAAKGYVLAQSPQDGVPLSAWLLQDAE